MLEEVPFWLNQNILIINSGTDAAYVLLHLLQTRLHEIFPGQCKTHIFRLNIDGDEKNSGLSTREYTFSSSSQSQSLYFENCSVSLPKFFVSNNVTVETEKSLLQDKNFKEVKVFNRFFESIQDESVKQDLLKKLYEKIIVNTAKKLNCKAIIFEDTMEDSAKNIIQNIVTGCFSNYHMQGVTKDKNTSNFKFLYPLKYCFYEEIITYLNYYDHQIMKQSFKKLKVHKNFTIQGVTEDFLCNLNNNFQFVSSTICKLLTKVTPSYKENSDKKCLLCTRSFNDANTFCEPASEIFKSFSDYISLKKIPDTWIESLLNSQFSQKTPAQEFLKICADTNYFRDYPNICLKKNLLFVTRVVC